MSKKEEEQREKFNLGVALKKATLSLSQADPRLVCLNSGTTYNREMDSYLLPYLNRKYLVNHSTGEVQALGKEKEISIHLQIMFLHYLVHADGNPLQKRWITFKELPGGLIYAEPYQNRAIKPLLKYFGQKTEQLQQIAASLEGRPASLGDTSVIMRPFPRVPVAFVLWEGDEEFSPSATILYDASAEHYLPTEDYALLPGLIIWEMAAMLPR